MERKKHKNKKRKDKDIVGSIQAPSSETYNPILYNEYKMMREELVNYMDKIQAVRNMMYVAAGTILALAISDTIPFLCTMLPLLFILPAYMSAVNYWICVRKASAYLVVFHESYEDCPIHWESRHNMLKKIGKKKKENFRKSTVSNIASQLVCYYACASITICVYALRLHKYVAEEMTSDMSSAFWDINIDGIPILGYIISGIVVILFLCIFFICASMGESYDSFLTKFLLIKSREEQKEIGKCWPDTDNLTKISEMLKKYL